MHSSILRARPLVRAERKRLTALAVLTVLEVLLALMPSVIAQAITITAQFVRSHSGFFLSSTIDPNTGKFYARDAFGF